MKIDLTPNGPGLVAFILQLRSKDFEATKLDAALRLDWLATAYPKAPAGQLQALAIGETEPQFSSDGSLQLFDPQGQKGTA